MIVIRIFPTLLSKKFVLKIDNIPYFYFLQQQPFQHAFVLFLFIIALSIGVFIGKLIFLLVFARKNKPRRKTIAFSSQYNQLKEQLLNDKTILKSN
jgi:hypothetical protein